VMVFQRSAEASRYLRALQSVGKLDAPQSEVTAQRIAFNRRLPTHHLAFHKSIATSTIIPREL
jgi:hypothetical protein